MIAETAQQQRVAVSPDLYTLEEAATYLRLPSGNAFHRRRKAAGITGVPVAGNKRMYAREQLEAIRRHMFALNK